MNNLNTNLILVTGGAGYIGSHAALALIEKGYSIVIFDSLENGHKKIHRKINDRRAGDSAVLVACNKKALEILGWSPKRSIEDRICAAYSWILKMKENI